MRTDEVAPGCPYVTQPFGCTDFAGEWYAPGLCGTTWYHRGVDLAGDGCCDTDLLATGSGVIQHVGQTFAGSDGLGPGAMVLRMDDGYLAVYGHGHAEVGVGQRVNKGDRIGRVGTQGFSTGCHLHLEICTSLGSVPNGCVDPLSYNGPGEAQKPKPRWEVQAMPSSVRFKNQQHAFHVDGGGNLWHHWSQDVSWQAEHIASGCVPNSYADGTTELVPDQLHVFANLQDGGLQHCWQHEGKWGGERI